jgi:hypothetical protein
MLFAAACYDDAPVWDELENVRNEMDQLASRVEALEKSVAEDVAAIQSMISVEALLPGPLMLRPARE